MAINNKKKNRDNPRIYGGIEVKFREGKGW